MPWRSSVIAASDPTLTFLYAQKVQARFDMYYLW